MIRFHRFVLFLISSFLIFFLHGYGAAETPVSVPDRLGMSEAILLAVQNNPRIAGADAGVSASEERLVAARSGFYPQISASGAVSRTTSPLWAFGTRLNQERIGIADFDPDTLNHPDGIDNYGVTLSAVWPLFDSGQTWYSVRQAKLGRTAAELMLLRTAQEVIARTISAYTGLLLSEQYLATVEQALTTAEANRRMVASRYANGMAVKSDFLQTEVHIADLNRQRLQAESNAAVARAELCAAMGLGDDGVFDPAGELEKGQETEGALDHWLATALAERPDLAAVRQQEAAAEAEVGKARAARFPSVGLSADYSTNGEEWNDGADSYTVGAQVSVPLFSGFRISAKVSEASANLKQAVAGQNALTQGISVEIRRAYFQTRSTWEQIAVSEAAVAQAEEALRIIQNRYDGGLLTIVELLNAELGAFQARTNRLRAIHDYNTAKADLLLAAGILDVDFR